MFDEKYIKTYVDIVSPEFTAQQITFLLKHLQLEKEAEILDLACGYGRHAIELAQRGYNVTGLDFSQKFIEMAKKCAQKRGVEVAFVQGDMRKISFTDRFDAVINMFTSFGYFEDESDNTLVLKNVSRALKRGGKFLIDHNNVGHLLARMLREGKKTKRGELLVDTKTELLSNGLRVTTKSEFHYATMRWSLTRSWEEKGRTKSYRTNVRLYSLPELQHLLEEAGLRVEKAWGDFQEAPFTLETPRMIVLARKP